MKPLQVDEIFQPRKFAFPSRNFGEEVRHFKGTWFENKNWNSWLHYDITSDSAFCYTCIKAIEKNMISSKNSEKALYLKDTEIGKMLLRRTEALTNIFLLEHIEKQMNVFI